MSEIIKKIMCAHNYKTPDKQKFYSFVREGGTYAAEKSERQGYTASYSEFGVFDREQAHLNVLYETGGGSLRFNIEKDFFDSIVSELESLRQDNEKLREEISKVNIPQVDDFMEAVKNEARHQRLRWKSEHDEGKEGTDWLWLLGWLAGKAVNKPEKRLHHIIATAAVCFNWHDYERQKQRKRMSDE